MPLEDITRSKTRIPDCGTALLFLKKRHGIIGIRSSEVSSSIITPAPCMT